MNLYLMRHGIAEELGARGQWNDSQRELTQEGERKVKQISEGLAALQIKFDLIVASPYSRAQRTAEIVSQASKHARLEISEHLIPGGSSKKLFEFLRGLGGMKEEILLVGHEPYLSDLASLLILGEAGGNIEMKKGGICKIRLAELREQKGGVLEWLLTPRQLRELA